MPVCSFRWPRMAAGMSPDKHTALPRGFSLDAKTSPRPPPASARGRAVRRPARPPRGRSGSPPVGFYPLRSPGTATRWRLRAGRPCPRSADPGPGPGRRAGGPSVLERGDTRVAGGDHQSIGFFAFVVAHKQPAGAARQIGHVRAPLVQDQVRFQRRESAEARSPICGTLEQTTAFHSIRAADCC
jgi:hypothetical protein